MKISRIVPQFVEFMPPELNEGFLYISQRFKTASHLCCCGCGTRIVTSLRETGWALTVKDDKVSLWPSIGNWDHPCRSHYIIRENQILCAEEMTPAQITRGRALDDARREAYYAPKGANEQIAAAAGAEKVGLLGRVSAWVGKLFARFFRI